VRGAQFGAISWLEPTLVLLAILVTLSSALARFSMALPCNLRRGTLNQSTDGGATDASVDQRLEIVKLLDCRPPISSSAAACSQPR
jgi:hypothetical protein